MKQDLKRYARMLADSGLTLGVCDWGFCVYRQEHSACFGSTTGPNPLRREPSTCASCRNFAVSAQHRAYWLEQARRHEAFLNEPALPTQTLKIARERLKEALAMSVRSTPHRRPRVVPAPSPADRLRQALETLTASASDRPERVTVSALCQLANVSRNSLYRYHPDVLRAVREHQGREVSAASVRLRQAVDAQQAELIALRQQITKLAALVDHYYAAYREAQALLARREQELAELRKRLDSKPVKIAG
jgi:hypothetical protein